VAGNLLIVESGKGITAYTMYASSTTIVWSWTYDPKAIAVGSAKIAVVTGMVASSHPTRSLIIPPKHPNLLVVSRGSNDNFNFPFGHINAARSNIKVFDLTSIPNGGYSYVMGGHTAG
jgi:hypothetical protein